MAPRGVAAGVEEDLNSVSENWGDFGGSGGSGSGDGSWDNDQQHPGPTWPAAAGPARGVDQAVEPGQRQAELRAHADAARAMAVHALRPPLPAPAERRDPRPVGPGPSTIRASLTCCSSATSCRRASRTCSSRSLWTSLKEEGLWDDSLIVVAADHGITFINGRRTGARLDAKLRRDRSDSAVRRGAGQRRGQGERHVRRDDRHPADDPRHPEHRSEGQHGRPLRVQPTDGERRRACGSSSGTASSRCASEPGVRAQEGRVRARNQALFGSGRDGPLRFLPRDSVRARSCSTPVGGGRTGSVQSTRPTGPT